MLQGAGLGSASKSITAPARESQAQGGQEMEDPQGPEEEEEEEWDTWCA